MKTTKTISSTIAVCTLALVLGGALCGGCAPSPEERAREAEEKKRAEAAAAVRPEAMTLQRLAAGSGETRTEDFDTASLAGKPWLLLAFRAGDPVCLGAAEEWNGLSAELGTRGCALVAVLPDFDAPAAASARGTLAGTAAFPVCGASRAQLDALSALAPMDVNPVAYLFDAAGKCVRSTAGFVRPEHHLEDADALLAGLPLPEHPAQGVLPEENAP